MTNYYQAGLAISHRKNITHHIGASILQTPGAVVSELDQINDDILALDHELHGKIADAPGYPHSPRTDAEGFYGLIWSPFIQDWQAWYAKNNGWWSNLWWNHAPEAEERREQLITLRERAKQLGIQILSPEPAEPPGGVISGVKVLIMEGIKMVLLIGITIVVSSFLVSIARHM